MTYGKINNLLNILIAAQLPLSERLGDKRNMCSKFDANPYDNLRDLLINQSVSQRYRFLDRRV